MSLLETAQAWQVSLPMYDWPEQHAANDHFWQLLRAQLTAAGFAGLPTTLNRDNEAALWQNEQTALSQTCGYPLVHMLPSRVHLLGTPNYVVPGFSKGHYASVVVVRAGDSKAGPDYLRQQRIAINSVHSQSGCNALLNLIESQPSDHCIEDILDVLITGSHRESIKALCAKTADVCAIDPVSWQLAKRHEPCTSDLRVLCTTSHTPALPLICSPLFADTYAACYDSRYSSLSAAFRCCWASVVRQDAELASALFLGDTVENISRSAYEAVPRSTLSLRHNNAQ